MKVRKVSNLLNQEILQNTGKKFTMLLATEPFYLSKKEFENFDNQYKKIKEFLSITNNLVYKALFNNKYKNLFNLMFFGKDKSYIKEQIYWYKTNKDTLPLFFRTDEPQPGIIAEIQCPGSGLAQLGELQKIWNKVMNKKLWLDWDKQIVKDIIKITGKKNPKLIHIPKSSCPEDAELFYQKTNQLGIEYINPLNKGINYYKKLTKEIISQADLIKVNSYGFQRGWPVFNDMLKLARKKDIIIDVPPALIFNMKINMALPFHPKTKHHYPDYIRSLFPKTTIVEPNKKIEFENKKLTYEEYSNLPDKKRKHIFKSASGISVADKDDGGRGVFSLSRTSKKKCYQLLKQASLDYYYGERSIIQPEMNKRYNYSSLQPDNSIKEESGYAKFSGFYGPNGLIAKRALFKNYYKVGGSKETVCAPILLKK